MALTDKMSVLTSYLKAKLVTNQGTLGLHNVYIDDQVKIPRARTACVIPGSKTRTMKGAPRQTRVNMEIYILVYMSAVTDTQENLNDAVEVAEAVESLIHADPDLGGQVVHCFITSVEPGYATRRDSAVRATRMTLSIQSQVLLPS